MIASGAHIEEAKFSTIVRRGLHVKRRHDSYAAGVIRVRDDLYENVNEGNTLQSKGYLYTFERFVGSAAQDPPFDRNPLCFEGCRLAEEQECEGKSLNHDAY